MADTHPGGNDDVFRNYWVFGKGRAKWNTWTELYHHIVTKVGDPEKAKRIAASWFHLRFGIWPGADLNRVRQGKAPRGEVVGRG